ncbi:hypothetical protein GWI34_16030 [Actinomadura sp. DSM 109109]|nr:hypothetical protein [Actinomadura lepetitiana]
MLQIALCGFILLELTIQQIGWGFTAVADPLASGLVTSVVGAVVFAFVVVRWTRSRLSLRSLETPDRWIVVRLAAGILILNAAYPYGIQAVGLGAIVTMSAIGPLCTNGSNLWKIWRHRRTVSARVLRGAALNVAVRVLALAAVVAINKPWAEFGHFRPEMLYGIAVGALGAWSFWNYLSCLYNDGYTKDQRLRILAVADLVAIPFTALAVWLMSVPLGGGFSELSWKVVALGSVAGILSFALPTLMGAWAADKISLSLSSLLYLFDSPIACLVGLAGASWGLLSSEQIPDAWVWGGMAVVVVAAVIAAKRPIPKMKLSDGGFLVEVGSKAV